MDKKNQIKYLDKFIKLSKDWVKARDKGYDTEEDLKEKLQEVWGVVEEIFKQLGISYHGELENIRMKGYKNRVGNLFIDGFIGGRGFGPQKDNIEKLRGLAIGARTKIKTSISLVGNTLPTVTLAINILESFPDVVSKFLYRRQGKSPLKVTDEYDVQDIIFSMMRGSFPTLQYENPNQKAGITGSIADFTINELGLFIEVKYIDKKGKEKLVQEECKKDIISYSKQPNCQKIIFFVYDPNRCIDNEHAFKGGLDSKIVEENKTIEIYTLVSR